MIAIGISWSIVFLVVALHYELQLYADGAMFSYAVAVQDVWAFHWHNISARVSVFILTLLPAELYVGLTGSPLDGIKVYGFLLYGAPLFSLICTFVADRSNGRIIFTYACGSTALLCPLIFGFPTEMWLAHALFWPALAISQYARRNLVGTALGIFYGAGTRPDARRSPRFGGRNSIYARVARTAQPKFSAGRLGLDCRSDGLAGGKDNVAAR